MRVDASALFHTCVLPAEYRGLQYVHEIQSCQFQRG